MFSELDTSVFKFSETGLEIFVLLPVPPSELLLAFFCDAHKLLKAASSTMT